MPVFSSSMGLCAVLIIGLSCVAWGQDQPAAGSPPPGAAAPAQTQQTPAQTQQPPEQNAAPAQNDALPPPPPDAQPGLNPRRQARMLARRLGLMPAQQAEIEPILANRQRRMRRARADATLAAPDRKALIQEINRNSVRRINAVLTPAQRQEYKQLRQERRARRLQREQQAAAPTPASNPQ